MNTKPKIALVFGGVGAEREVSLAGAEFVFTLISPEKYAPLSIFIAPDGRWLSDPTGGASPRQMTENVAALKEVFPAKRCAGGGFISDEGFIPIDTAIPLLHGEFGEDGRVQGLFDCAGIPYVGSGVTAGAVAMDKAYTKALAESLGVPTARWTLAIMNSPAETPTSARERAEAAFGYPMFLKPARQGSSVGAGIARCEKEFESALEAAAAAGDGRVIIEEYIDNRVELECAYLGTKSKQLFTPIGEISCCGFYDYDAKYGKDSAARVSAVSKHEAAWGKDVREWSRKIVEQLGVRHLARLDFFLSGKRLIFNEINTFPGFTEISLYPRLISRLGISPAELIELLISDTLV